MKKFYFLLIMMMAAFTFQVSAQSTFSFSCAKDTIVNSCVLNCISLKTRIPDIHGLSTSYVINATGGPAAPSGGCYRTYVDPGANGPVVLIDEDDTYSPVIPLPFTFNFYGASYNSLVASGNGYLSFDVSLAGQYSHWPIAANLPSTTYDRALIMGPYHDLFPTQPTSPSQKIKFEVLGSAPNRRAVLSFYKIPLYSCTALIENTHQIVLYEGVGVVEVFISSKQVCASWNSGRAIVGMQNFARNQGIMAPGRTATSPPWSVTSGNEESWRFVPTGGPALYRSAKLYDLAGNLVSTGDTIGVGNGQLEVTFPNVCATASNVEYVIRTEYANFNNPALLSVGTDTLRVTYQGAINATSTVTNIRCNGASTGTIVITNPSGGTPPYQYQLNGGTPQPSNTFSNLGPGTYTVRIKDAGVCFRDTIINITEPAPLSAVTNKTDATCGVPGNITVSSTTGGVGPYTYSLNGSPYQAQNTFSVPNGNYTVTVKDANDCTVPYNITIALINNLTLTGRADTTICAGASIRLSTTSTATTFLWDNAGSLDDPNSSSPVASPTVPTVYHLVATLGQCQAYDTVTIDVVQQVSVYAGPDVTITTGEKAQLNGSITNASTYLWSPAANLSSATILNPVASPVITTMYKLTATNSNGCASSDSVLVTVVPYCIKVKNSFTPNGDGINDLWEIYDKYDCMKNISLGVFNRYGNKVFESSDYRNGWDGRYQGKPIPDGTYYAVIKFTLISGQIIVTKTDLTILR